MQPLQDKDGYEAWRAGLQTPATAELCLRFALSFNKLDASWFLSALAPDVTCESQSVFDVLEGADAVSGYIRGKMNTLRLSRDAKVRGELATLSSGEPCVALFQARDRYQTNWLNEALSNVTFQTDGQGRATRIFMITGVPSPACAVRSGIYPGCEPPVTESPKRFVRPDTGYAQLRFEVFLLNGRISLDLEMRRRIAEATRFFPHAQVCEIVTETACESEWRRVHRAGFNGFPAVAAYWKEQIIHLHQGVIFLNSYVREIQSSTALYLVSRNSQ